MDTVEILLGNFSESEYVNRARELVPVIASRAAKQWQVDHILPETIDDLKSAGLFRMMQPKRWGGGECRLSEFYEVVSTIAEADASVAWVLSVVSVHSFHLALFPERAQEDVWGANPTALIGSPYMPGGKAIPVEGGYRFSGHWKFSSGSKHCDWTFLGGLMQDGTPPDPSTRYPKNHCAFLLPRCDYKIIDNWQVHGMRSTGSHDIVVEDAFIPEHRVLPFSALIEVRTPGHEVNPGPLYKMSFFQVFSRATSLPVAVGALKGMADQIVGYGQKRSGIQSRAGVGNTAQDPSVWLALANAYSGVDELKAVMHRSFIQMERWLEAGEKGDIDKHRMYRFQTGAGPARCAQLASELYRVCGGSGISETLPFGRYFNDIHAMRSHITNHYQPHANAWIASMLGIEVPTWPL